MILLAHNAGKRNHDIAFLFLPTESDTISYWIATKYSYFFKQLLGKQIFKQSLIISFHKTNLRLKNKLLQRWAATENLISF